MGSSMGTITVPDNSVIFSSGTTQGLNGVTWAFGILVFTFSFVIFLALYKLIRRKTHGAAKTVLGGGSKRRRHVM